MQHKRPPIPVIVMLILVVAISAWFLVQTLRDGSNDVIKASGTIDAVSVNVSPELAGKITEVKFSEGDTVITGDVMFVLDDTLLQAQRGVAAAALESAKAAAQTAQVMLESARAQYELTVHAARTADRKTRTQDWRSPEPNLFNQPAWYFTRTEQIQAAQVEIEAAKTALADAMTNLTKVEQEVGSEEFLKIEKQLLNARTAYLVARDVYYHAEHSYTSDEVVGRYNRIHYGYSSDVDLSDAGQTLFDNAKAGLEDAQRAYDDLLSTDTANEVLNARAELSVAQERYDAAQDRLRALQTGDQSPQVSAAQKAVEQAEAAAAQALVAVSQAEAQLALFDAQLEKLSVQAPMKGVVLTRNVEPGEVVQPGAIAIILARLDDLTITVYIPEDRYGEISLGQLAEVSVDSFPGEIFSATVVHIADQAEFTPRNVQTVEGRSTTVFAIKLRVDNLEGKLKPGMPADVLFGR